MNDWKREALLLAEEGTLSWRQISLMLGVPKSTVSDFLRDNLGTQPVVGKEGPKILFLDIETAPLKAFIWSMWQQGVSLNQINSDWFILSYCAKWAHSEEVFYNDLRGYVNKEDDLTLLAEIHKLLDEADFVVTQNGRKFDIKKINARLILNGLGKPSTFRQIDTLEIAKRQFGFTSRKLEYMTEKLCKLYVKSKHKKFPGFELWVECLKDNPEAWAEMEEYNRGDVLSLEELYEIFIPWDNTLPNFALYFDGIESMDDWEENGFHYTNLGKYQRYRNVKTGQQRRGRVNLLSKEKRQSLLANIIV
jgi:hypothetical protein